MKGEGETGGWVARLPRTFATVFGRFPALSAVQQAALPPILEGREVALCSATASGKTEAYFAPLAERALARRACGDGAGTHLVVSPTRALANDLHRRLAPLASGLRLSLGRITGEHKERDHGHLRAFTITTPESLDSLLARRPEQLEALRALVLDEIHILDGTPRGDHLRLLLERVERHLDRPAQRVLASATVESPAELAERYLRDPVVVTVPGAREIRGTPLPGRDRVAFMGHLEKLAAAGLRKILCFCNARNEVEALAAGLRNATPFGPAIHAHHGSLAQGVREEVERRFLRESAGVCIATMTLEMGIDIGSVDYVVLSGPPPNVSSLLQRIGRGGRRGAVTRVGYAFDGPHERHQLETMLRQGARGKLCGGPYAFRPGVLVQQALVLACTRGSLRSAEFERALPSWVPEAIAPASTEALVETLVEKGRLEVSRLGPGRVPAEAIERRYERGDLHGNIEARAETAVVDRVTGQEIGRVAGTDGRRMSLGGAEREIVARQPGRVLVERRGAGGTAEVTRFSSAPGPTTSLALARAVIQDLGVAAETFEIWAGPGGLLLLLHGLGSFGGAWLASTLGGRRGGVLRVSPFTLRLERDPETWPAAPGEEELARHLARSREEIARRCGMGPFHRDLPDELQACAVRAASGLDEVRAYWRRTTYARKTPDPDGLEIALRW